MKKTMQNITLFVMACMGVSALWAYEFNVSNFTGKDLVVRLRPWGVSQDWYALIPAEGEVKLIWNDGNCLGSVEWAEAPGKNDNERANNFDNLVKTYTDKLGRIDGDPAKVGSKQRKFGDNWHTGMISTDMRMQPNEVYDATSEAAKNIAKGADKLICQILQSAESSSWPGQIKDIVKSFSSKKDDKKDDDKDDDKNDNKKDDDEKDDKKDDDQNDNKKDDDLERSVGGSAHFASFNTDAFSVSAKEDDDGKECKIGLGKIVKAAAKVAGNTLCKTRSFIIVPELNDEGEYVLDKTKLPFKMKLFSVFKVGE